MEATTTTVQAFNSKVIHLGERIAGYGVISRCNGRAMVGFAITRPIADITCKRCVKKLAS